MHLKTFEVVFGLRSSSRSHKIINCLYVRIWTMNHLSESASWFITTVVFDNILAASTMKGDSVLRKSFNHKEIIWNVDIIFNWERDVLFLRL